MKRPLHICFASLLALLVSLPCQAATTGAPVPGSGPLDTLLSGPPLLEHRGESPILGGHNLYAKHYASGDVQKLRYEIATNESVYVNPVSAVRAPVLLDPLALLVPPLGSTVGETAPDFTAKDTFGRSHTLSEYGGKYVVLEWHNRYCPYTHKHYASGNMQKLQKEWTARGVIWFTVISSAPGLQGYVTAADENAYVSRINAAPTAVLLDPSGQLGHLYDARTTPEMYVINPEGVLIYEGAIDDKPTTDIADVSTAKNYVSLALQEAMAGRKVSIPVTRPYGCSVKYAN